MYCRISYHFFMYFSSRSPESDKQQSSKRSCECPIPEISPPSLEELSSVCQLEGTSESTMCYSSALEESAPHQTSDSQSTTGNLVSVPVICPSIGQIDLGAIVHAAHNSLDQLRHISGEMEDAKKLQYLVSHFKPASTDTLHSHPVFKQGRCWNASFQQQWLEKFQWLSYSNELEGGLCRYCILFPERPNRGGSHGANPGVLVLGPYQKPYTKALGRDGLLISHEKSSMHRHATEKADVFIQNFKTPDARIDNRLMKQQSEQEQKNKEVLRQIVLAVEFLAKQGLPFRGNKEDRVNFADESVNRGNFIAILQLLGKGNTCLQDHLLFPKCTNALYTSKTIQNEIIHIYACKVREYLTKQTRDMNLPFTVIADEVTDSHANREIISVCLRFVDLTSLKNPHIRECLINFLFLERANASSICKKILESLSHPSVSLDPTKIRGQAYDGAAVMSSEMAGVQAKIKDISPLALYTHCFSHCLNLSIAASCKVQAVRNLIGLINEAYLFLTNSPKRQRLFEKTVMVYLPDSSHSKLPGLCKTRWVERHTCFEVFLEMYEAVVTFLDAIISPHEYPDLASQDGNWNWDRDTKVKAQGLKASLSSFQTIAVFIITKNVLDEVKVISSKLQKREQDVYDAYKMITTVIENINSTRNNIDTIFDLWYGEVLTLGEHVGVTESVPRKTSLQRNRTNVPSDTPCDYYKRAIAIPLLDSLYSQMKERFSAERSHAQRLLFLVPSIVSSDSSTASAEDAMEALLYWEKDLPFPRSLRNELRRWQVIWKNSKSQSHQAERQRECNSPIPDTFLLALASCDIDSFPNIHQLLVIACTLPITSAEAERSFSLLRRIKTYLRSTMAEERLADLGVIAMHYSERISIDDVCLAFIQAHPRRLFQPSLFTD